MSHSPKRHLRKLARATLDRLPESERRFRSALLTQRLVDFLDARYGHVRKVATFAALPHEPDLSLVHSLRPKLDLCYPLVREERRMTFHLVADPTTLVKGAYSIPEPNPQIHPPVPAEELELLLVPGLAYDIRGYRLGHGAGFYDRLLDEIPLTPRLGITFASQLLPLLPNEPHDLAVQTIISDHGVRPTTRG